MEEIKKSNAGQGFGVAGFVLGLVALILSFIPCLGMWAFAPGALAVIFSVVALSQASSANAAKGLIIAALIISILGTAIASWQFVTIRRAASGLGKFGTEFQETFSDDFGDELRNNIRRALKDTADTEAIEEDTTAMDTEEMIRELERLEGQRNNN